jgi:hypothetical protein
VTRLTVDLDGQVLINDNQDASKKMDPSFSVGADLIFTRTPSAELGLGVEYQKERPWPNKTTIQFIPIYGFINYHGSSNSWRRGTQPYFSGRFGYSLFYGPIKENSNFKYEGGLYYSLGLGINFQDQFRVEVNHSSCSGQENSSFLGYPRKYTYNRTSVSFGIAF